MISEWILLCFSYDQRDGKVIGNGSSVDFGYKFVLHNSNLYFITQEVTQH